MILPSIGFRSIRVQTSDFFPLSVRHFPAALASRGETPAVAIFLGATGVSQQRFHDLAIYFAQTGWHALTFDYRGIGESVIPPGIEDRVSMQAWGEQDLAALIGWADSEFGSPRIALIGHSIGGQIAALASNTGRVSAMLAIGGQKGYWRLWPDWRRYIVFGFFRIGVPFCLKAFGYVPLQWMRLHSLRPGVASDYARWTLRADYQDAHGRSLTPSYRNFTAPILSISFDDDVIYAPKPTVDELMEKFYVNAQVVRAHLISRNFTPLGLGHSGFFEHNRCPQALWSDCSDWLSHVVAGRSPHNFSFSILPTYRVR